MKATYQKPETILVLLQTVNMIANSPFADIVDNGQDLDDAPTTEEISGNLSRRNVWDDEE